MSWLLLRLVISMHGLNMKFKIKYNIQILVALFVINKKYWILGIA